MLVAGESPAEGGVAGGSVAVVDREAFVKAGGGDSTHRVVYVRCVRVPSGLGWGFRRRVREGECGLLLRIEPNPERWVTVPAEAK